jgi:hypothetical protein
VRDWLAEEPRPSHGDDGQHDHDQRQLRQRHDKRLVAAGEPAVMVSARMMLSSTARRCVIAFGSTGGKTLSTYAHPTRFTSPRPQAVTAGIA